MTMQGNQPPEQTDGMFATAADGFNPDAFDGLDDIPKPGDLDYNPELHGQSRQPQPDQQDQQQKQGGDGEKSITLSPEEYEKFKALVNAPATATAPTPEQAALREAEEARAIQEGATNAAVEWARGLVANKNYTQEQAADAGEELRNWLVEARKSVNAARSRDTAIVEAIRDGYPVEEALKLLSDRTIKSPDDVRRITGDYTQKKTATTMEERLAQIEKNQQMILSGQPLAGQRFGAPGTALAGGASPRTDATTTLEEMIRATNEGEETPELASRFEQFFGF